jgi:hypothetical protein
LDATAPQTPDWEGLLRTERLSLQASAQTSLNATETAKALCYPEACYTEAKAWPQGQIFFRTWISARHLGQVFFHDRPEESGFS